MSKEFRLLIFRITLIIFTGLGSLNGYSNNSTKASKHILLLQSYHRGMEWTDSVERGITDALQNSSFDCRVTVEYMDSKKHSSEEHFQMLCATNLNCPLLAS